MKTVPTLLAGIISQHVQCMGPKFGIIVEKSEMCDYKWPNPRLWHGHVLIILASIFWCLNQTRATLQKILVAQVVIQDWWVYFSITILMDLVSERSFLSVKKDIICIYNVTKHMWGPKTPHLHTDLFTIFTSSRLIIWSFSCNMMRVLEELGLSQKLAPL